MKSEKEKKNQGTEVRNTQFISNQPYQFFNCFYSFVTPVQIQCPYATFKFPIMHRICPPKVLHKHIVFSFSWDGCNTQEKWKTTLGCAKFLGQIRCIMGNVEVVNPFILIKLWCLIFQNTNLNLSLPLTEWNVRDSCIPSSSICLFSVIRLKLPITRTFFDYPRRFELYIGSRL